MGIEIVIDVCRWSWVLGFIKPEQGGNTEKKKRNVAVIMGQDLLLKLFL